MRTQTDEKDDAIMPTPTGDPWLLTPGPLTTSVTVKQAMLHDWGSRDAEFIAVNRRVRERLVELAGGQGSHVAAALSPSRQ
jgi:2-aminoethylphosphonate-pyruvate transaminase